MQKTSHGFSFPIGARVYSGAKSGGPRAGVNFSVYSKDSTGMDLLLFSAPEDPDPVVLPFHPQYNRTSDYWHMFVPGLKAGQLYAFRAHGPNIPELGLRFDPQKALLDPYGRGVVFPEGYDRGAAVHPGENYASALKSVVADPSRYNWQGDHPLQRPFARTVIYEMHVAGFTRSPSSGLAPGKAGTYAGLVEKIPYLKDLGITAVELLPVQAFDPFDAPPGKKNYWGYSPISFFSPHPFYASRYDPAAKPLAPLDEFRDMVKALHKAGIEVILDVVYNHTGEGNQDGPTLSFKGLANPEYYILDADQRYYANYTGTGNTLNANEPIVRRMILDSLRYWVAEMHVDGFRFDLASILSRDEGGHPLSNPPSLLDIETDPVLAGTKLIAEAWDAAGLYQVGSFIGDRWQEWNGRFRDDLRAWVRCDVGSIRSLPNRLLGSPDIYEHENREAEQSINFITCHDGFTLNDVVSYNTKHNDANGENNRDGSDNNFSWNYGAEGPSDNPTIAALRERQVKNLLAYTLLSIGTPMLLMGDEVRRTQHGNNNAYAQDNEISWFDWRLVDANPTLLRFVRELVRFRLRYTTDPGDEGLTLSEELRQMKITWHGLRLHQPDWGENSHSLAVTLAKEGHRPLHLIFNAFWEPLVFELPPGMPWKRIIDTCLPSPDDITPVKKAKPVVGNRYTAGPRSVVALIA